MSMPMLIFMALFVPSNVEPFLSIGSQQSARPPLTCSVNSRQRVRRNLLLTLSVMAWHAVACKLLAHGNEPVHLLDLGGGSALLGLQFRNALFRVRERLLFGENGIAFQLAACQLGVLGFQAALFRRGGRWDKR